MLVYIGPFFNPNQVSSFTLLGLGYPYLLLINLGFIFIWLVFAKKYVLISTIVVLIGTTYVDRFYGLTGSGLEMEQSDIQVLSLNTQGFYKAAKDPEAFDGFVDHAQGSDIILLQECSSSAVRKLKDRLDGYHLFQPNGLTLAIFSKTPIEGSGLVNKENAANGSTWIDTKINGQSIRVYNAHLRSNKVTQAATDLIDSPDITNEQTWSDAKSVLTKIRDMSKLRADQVTEISEHISGTDKPILLGGDFNDTPVSNTYRRLSKNFTDSFCAAGKGVGTTYAGKIPLLRIDYIFADDSFTVVDHKVINSSISDHYPIKSVIRLHR